MLADTPILKLVINSGSIFNDLTMEEIKIILQLIQLPLIDTNSKKTLNEQYPIPTVQQIKLLNAFLLKLFPVSQPLNILQYRLPPGVS